MWKQTLIVVSVILLLAGLVFVGSSRYASGVTTEFCPEALEVRYSEEILLWGTDCALYRSKPRKTAYRLVDYLVETGHWTPIHGRDRWIVTAHTNRQWRNGLTRFHREVGSGRGEDWVMWTQKHPEAAKVLWPLVLQLTRSNDSDLDAAGYLLFCARTASSPEEVQVMFDHVVNELGPQSKSR